MSTKVNGTPNACVLEGPNGVLVDGPATGFDATYALKDSKTGGLDTPVTLLLLPNVGLDPTLNGTPNARVFEVPKGVFPDDAE